MPSISCFSYVLYKTILLKKLQFRSIVLLNHLSINESNQFDHSVHLIHNIGSSQRNKGPVNDMLLNGISKFGLDQVMHDLH